MPIDTLYVQAEPDMLTFDGPFLKCFWFDGETRKTGQFSLDIQEDSVGFRIQEVTPVPAQDSEPLDGNTNIVMLEHGENEQHH